MLQTKQFCISTHYLIHESASGMGEGIDVDTDIGITFDDTGGGVHDESAGELVTVVVGAGTKGEE